MDDHYVPTLGEYAEIIEWLANDNGPLPQSMQKAYVDAIDRAGMRRFARSMEDMLDATEFTLGYRPPEWQMVWLNADWARSEAFRASVASGRVRHDHYDALNRRLLKIVEGAVEGDIIAREEACRIALELTDGERRNTLHLLRSSDGSWSVACMLPGSGRRMTQILLDEYEAEHGEITADEMADLDNRWLT